MQYRTCSNAIFNKVWGQYKCNITKQNIYDGSYCKGCPNYKKGEPKISKDVTPIK